MRTIRFLLDPTSEEFMPWLKSAKAAIPETRGMMTQAFLAAVFIRAGFSVTVGRELDIYARGRRALLVEVKSSLGGKFGSRTELTQLDGYLTAGERKRAEVWLAVLGITKPMKLRDKFRTEIRKRNIALIDVLWVSPQETLLPHLPSVP